MLRPVAAVEREGDADLFAVVAADLEAVGAPAQIGARDSDAAVVTALDPASMALEQKAMDLHHPIDPLAVGGRTALGHGFAAQPGPDAGIAVAWHVVDDCLNLGQQRLFRQGWTASALGRAPGRPLRHARGEMRTGHFQRRSDGVHGKPSLGSDSDRNLRFFISSASSRASFRISTSRVFLPRRRCNSRICSC